MNDVVEWMKTATYDEKSWEVSSTMDAYITEVESEDKEVNLKEEGKKEIQEKSHQ